MRLCPIGSLFSPGNNTQIPWQSAHTFSSLGIAQKVLSWFLLFFFLSSSPLWAGNIETKYASRIISTSPSITETLFDLGLKNRVIAVTDFCKYPEVACQLPSIGGMINPNIETIVSLMPDLIIHQSDNQKIARNAKNLGIPTLEVAMGNLTEIFSSLEKLGTALNCEEQANDLLLRLKDGIAFYQKQQLPKKEVLLLLGDGSDPSHDLYAVGPGTFLNELLNISGGKNIVSDTSAPYPKISKEYIIEKSPAIIIEAGPKSDLQQNEIDHRIQEWNRFPTIKAVKNKQIYFIGADYILIPGPRLLHIIEQFSKAIHPELFGGQNKKTGFQETHHP